MTVEHLRVVRGGRPVISDLSLALAQGSVTGLVGPSGCGKSTLMRSIVGVQLIAGGTITVLGQPAGAKDLRRRIGYSTQSPAVYGDLTVNQNLAYFASILDAGSDVDRVLDELGLAPQRNQRVSQLSGGQVTRTSLGIALLGQPELLVLDEPTVGLDPLLREELWSLFYRMRNDRRASLLISTHVMDEAARCERLILMRDGQVLAHDSPQELCRRTGTPDVEQAFLALVREREMSGAKAAG